MKTAAMGRRTPKATGESSAPTDTRTERWNVGAEEPETRLAAQRMTTQFAPMYLTLGSILQGVALSTLVARVEATPRGFNATDWLLAAATFLALLTVGQVYLLQVMTDVWVPTFFDSLAPSALGAACLFVARSVVAWNRLAEYARAQ